MFNNFIPYSFIMSTSDAITILHKSEYDWNSDPKGYVIHGVIPWDRCLHCAKKQVNYPFKYCKKCEIFMMFKEASAKIDKYV